MVIDLGSVNYIAEASSIHPSQRENFVVRVSGRRARTINCSGKLEAGDIIAQSQEQLKVPSSRTVNQPSVLSNKDSSVSGGG